MGRAQARLTVGEQLAKAMMRRRACKSGFKFDQPKKKKWTFFHSIVCPRAVHYVEARDDLEIKVGKINRRLLKLVQEGEHVCIFSKFIACNRY